ncbi:MAG: protein N-lysine methyltransferase family protein [Planctomycetota bacterium]|nr:protein N-lysine methyltransferase family protein [Planctomycetota bacterium]
MPSDPASLPALFPHAPLREQRLQIGSHALSILALCNPLDLIQTRTEKAPEVYWAELWHAGIALAGALLDGEIDLPEGPEPVLELGCGTGVVSVAAALRGARVLATDFVPEALELTAENARRHGIGDRVETRRLDFREPYPARHRLILASDCIYDPEYSKYLAEFVRATLAPGKGSKAVLADPDRWSARNFSHVAREAGLEVACRRRAVPCAIRSPLSVRPAPKPGEVEESAPRDVALYELTLAS